MKSKLRFAVILAVAVTIALSVAGKLCASPVMSKWVDPLPIPPVAVAKQMPGISNHADYYEMKMVAHKHQFNSTLPGPATVWTYTQGDDDDAGFLGPTFVAKSGRPVVVKWINQLPTDTNDFPLKNSIDPTLPGSDLPTGRAIPHLHGGHSAARFDGTPDQWWTADGVKGMDYVTDTFTYDNDQPATLLWYHDHSMGATRLNPYLGLAGGYILFDNYDNDSTIGGQKVPSGYGKYHLPIVLQDKQFNDDGSLFYPTQGNTAIHPVWVPEFFGDTPVINGIAYPYLDAQPRRYRLRLLNGSQARFYNLRFSLGDDDLPFWVIGSEGGLLPAPVRKTSLLIAPGERYDVIVDFTGIPLNSTVMLTNDAAAPYPMGDPENDNVPELMQIRINTAVPKNDPDLSVPPARLRLRKVDPVPAVPQMRKRDIVLREDEDPITGEPVQVLLNGYHYMDPVTDFVKAGSTEMWRFINLTGDAHPMHLHLVQFQVVNRQKFDVVRYAADWQNYLDSGRAPWLKPSIDFYLIGRPIPPAPEEWGFKDTVKSYPSLDPNDDSYSYVTRIVAKFDLPPSSRLDYDPKTGIFGKWVYHCHILEHEENDMMRPYEIVR